MPKTNGDATESYAQLTDREAYALLSHGTRMWVSRQNWPGFRDIQRQSIERMLGVPKDERGSLVISAPTASGKTEAAFLPMLSMIEEDVETEPDVHRIRGMYVAPLKALINDQYRRLTEMASYSDIDVYMWHGDAPQGQKNRLLKSHDGILMTTPESLESFLMRRGGWCQSYLTPDVIVIDEFHSFLGEGRGKQLLDLLARVGFMTVAAGYGRPLRIALSATLSELDTVAYMLEPDIGATIITGGESADESELTVKCYEPVYDDYGDEKPDTGSMAKSIVAGSGFDKTLTFCRSREGVETTVTAINDVLDEDRKGTGDIRVAMPHHGLLSRQTREELEHRLVSTTKPTMAVATVTLELGIDIGDIAKVYQIGSTTSVASLRQRMGRSGRRDGRRVMEVLMPIDALNARSLQTCLIDTISEIELMRNGWFEPPSDKRRDVSVLVSEILSVLCQYGCAYPDEIHAMLCEHGAFRNVRRALFDRVLDDMLEAGLVEESPDGTYVIGPDGEHEVNDWHFFATFQDQECYTVRCGERVIGEVTPPDTVLSNLVGMSFRLGGKSWQVQSVDFDAKVIDVTQISERAEYMRAMSSGSIEMAGMIRRYGISLLAGSRADYIPRYLDENGRKALTVARKVARDRRLNGLGLSLCELGGNGAMAMAASALSQDGKRAGGIGLSDAPNAGGDAMQSPARDALIGIISGDDGHSTPDFAADTTGSDTSMGLGLMYDAGYVNDAIVSCEPPVDKAALNAILALMERGVALDDDGGTYWLDDFNNTCDGGSGGTMAQRLACVSLWRLAELVNGALEVADNYVGHEGDLIDIAMLADIRGREKNNKFLDDDTLAMAYGPELMDIEGAERWLTAFQRFYAMPVNKRNGR